MRISSNLFFQTGLNSINAQQSDLMHLYQQIGSGQRMVTPADDPLAAAQAINIGQAQALNKRFAENREVAKNSLGIESNTLDSVTTLLQDVKTRLIEAGNGTMSDADRATLAGVLKSSKETLLGLANAKDGNGQYLFSGHAGSQPAFVTNADGKVTYNGDANQRLIQADQTRQIAGSDIGTDIFMRATAGARDYVTSANASPPNQGTGLIGKPTVTDPKGAFVGKSFEIEFADNAGVLQYTINIMDASGVAAADPIGPLDYVAGSTTLNMTGGVQVEFSGAPVAGDKFTVQPANTRGYEITANEGSTLVGSAPFITDTDPATAPYFGKPFVIKFDPAPAVTFNVTYYTDDTLATPMGPAVAGTIVAGKASLAEAGLELDISGTAAAGDTLTVLPGKAQSLELNIFDTLDGVIKALTAPTEGDAVKTTAMLNTLGGAIQRIDLNYNQVLTVNSSLGSRLNEIDAIGGNGTLRNLGYTSQLSRLEDLDYYTATAQLQLRQSALEAAALAFKQLQGTSLFNMGSK